MSQYDTIIIGGGHNGMVCATLLAKAGQKVVVLEANAILGGLAATREFYPSFNAPLATTLYAMPQKLVDELQLHKHGFTSATNTLDLIGLSRNEEPIRVTAGAVTGGTDEDSASYKDYRSMLTTFAKALAPFWSKVMPAIGDRKVSSLATFGQLGLKLRSMGKADMLEFFRVAMLPMRDLVDEYFKNESLRAALCWDGLVGTSMAPRSPNQSVITVLSRMAGSHDGLHTIPPQGIGSLISALETSAVASGVEIRTASPVSKIIVEGDEHGQRVDGVLLGNGETISASRVVSSADPKTTFLNLVGAPALEIEFTNRIRRLRTKGYVAKLNLALSSLPKFNGLDEPNGRMITAEKMDDLEFAWDSAKYGELPERPVMEVIIPSLRASGLAPNGKHVLSANVMYIPGQLTEGWTDSKKHELVSRLIAILDEHAPGLSSLVEHAELLTPDDIETEFHTTGGHWHHAEPSVDQLLMMRPTYEAAQYATPIPGLFLCGAGSHPGGDLSGNAGRNAAKAILS